MAGRVKVAIIGGGISGLSAAYYLSKAGIRATLIEKQDRLGGVIETHRVADCIVEAGPDSFLASKPAALELIRDIGLESEVISSNDHLRRTYIKKNGRLVPMPDGLMMMVPTKIGPIAASNLISWPTKIKMGLEYFRKPSTATGDRSVAHFVREHYGQETVDYLAEPLLSGVYGGDPEELSASATLGHMVALETKYGSLTRGVLESRKKTPPGAGGSLFRTMKGGLGQLVDAIEAKLTAERVHAAATAVERTAAGFRVTLDSGSSIEADKVIVACPAHAAGTLLRALDPAMADGLSAVRYNSSMTIGLIYDKAKLGHPLNGFGFLIPKVEQRKMAACTWVGTKFSHRVPDHLALIRCFIGGGIAATVEEIRDELRELMGVTAEPVTACIHRWDRAMAQYTVGHAGRIADITGRAKQIPGLYLAGNAYEGIGIPDCIRTGRAAAESALD